MSGPTNTPRPLGREAHYPFARKLGWRLNRFLFPPLPNGSVKILEEPGGVLKLGLLLAVDVAGPVRAVAVEADGRWHVALWPVSGSLIRLPDYADLVAHYLHLHVLHRTPPWRIVWWCADAATPIPAIRFRLMMASAGRYAYEYPILAEPVGVPAALIAKLQQAAAAGYLVGQKPGATP
ncbi:hypothetical protein [Caulobacter sp. 3R27C2-B]|uniref:hypothetical protein n=1 Tax=Caulobacter sp. 3R27C2-B TaxID=2502219 RepID=UPI0010FA062F|nr:hypothetical protein [Caulobacter sp. 3R27C2-B]